MGICESTNNSTINSNDNNRNNQISFRCYYNVENINEKINIIFMSKKNDIKSKIKILNGNKKEKLIEYKKFNKIGINTIDFITKGKLTDMSDMFFCCSSLIKIEFISIDTSKVNNMSYMFYSCSSLEYLDLSCFDTSNVEDMGGMFDDCYKLKEIKGINNIYTPKVTDMWEMFNYCKSLEYLDLSNFDTSNVKNMKYMFHGCSKLKEIKGTNNFNTSKVTDMYGMFDGCKSLEYLDISSFDTSNVEDMAYIFAECSKLKKIKGINNLNNSKDKNKTYILKGCDELDYSNINLYDIFGYKIRKDNHKLISEKEKKEKKESIIAVMFFIPDQNIHYSISCKDSDPFSKIESKLFEEFPELKSKNIYYLAKGNKVDKTATLEQNKIKNGDTILINYIDD